MTHSACNSNEFCESRPLGQSLRPLLDSLSASSQSGIPLVERPFPRAPSPDTNELEQAIEQARRDSLKLAERRNNILEKVEKLEKKKAKKQLQQGGARAPSPPLKSSSVTQSSNMADAAGASADIDEQETPKAPREPPIVFKGTSCNERLCHKRTF